LSMKSLEQLALEIAANSGGMLLSNAYSDFAKLWLLWK
jgi:hypothetical protein